MPALRKRQNHDRQPAPLGKRRRAAERERNDIATGGRWGMRDIQKSFPMGETIIVNQALGAKELLPAPVTDHETPDEDEMDVDLPSPPMAACQPSEPRDLTQGQGKTGWDGDGEKYTHRSVEPEATVTISARDEAAGGGVAYIPVPQGYAPATPAGPLTTQTSAADTYNGHDCEGRLDRLEKLYIRLQEQQDSTKERVDGNEETLRSMLEEDKRRREAKEAARQEEKAKEEQRRKRKEEDQKEMKALLEGMNAFLRIVGGHLEPPAPPTEAEPSNGDRLLAPPANPQLGSKNLLTYGPDVGRQPSKTHNTRSKAKSLCTRPADIIWDTAGPSANTRIGPQLGL